MRWKQNDQSVYYMIWISNWDLFFVVGDVRPAALSASETAFYLVSTSFLFKLAHGNRAIARQHMIRNRQKTQMSSIQF